MHGVGAYCTDQAITHSNLERIALLKASVLWTWKTIATQRLCESGARRLVFELMLLAIFSAGTVAIQIAWYVFSLDCTTSKRVF